MQVTLKKKRVHWYAKLVPAPIPEAADTVSIKPEDPAAQRGEDTIVTNGVPTSVARVPKPENTEYHKTVRQYVVAYESEDGKCHFGIEASEDEVPKAPASVTVEIA